MPIKAKLHIPESDKNIVLGDTTIKWNQQELEFIYGNGKRHVHKLTEPQWNYLTGGLTAVMNQIPNISDIEIPEFDPDLDS